MDTRLFRLPAAIVLTGLLATLGACNRQESPPSPQTTSNAEGPAERAGKEIDQAATAAGEKMAEAKDKAAATANEAERKTGETLERAGEKMQQDANK